MSKRFNQLTGAVIEQSGAFVERTETDATRRARSEKHLEKERRKQQVKRPRERKVNWYDSDSEEDNEQETDLERLGREAFEEATLLLDY
jgi:hypothetical protein